MNDINALKLAAIRAAAAISDYDRGRIDVLEKRLAVEEYEKLVSEPANVLALVEAMETKEEQRANWFHMAQKLGEDLDAAEKRIAELESRTVTVRLPEYRNSPDMHTKQYYEAIGFNQGLDVCVKALTAAGIQVIEGEGQ